jgi:hypothetical protein
MALTPKERQANYRRKHRSETHDYCSCGKEKMNWAKLCVSCNRKKDVGEKNVMWKGDKVGYRVLHLWVERHLGKPNFCEICRNGKLKPRQYQWANKSHLYIRELSDWVRLCVKCHQKYDKDYKKLLELPK